MKIILSLLIFLVIVVVAVFLYERSISIYSYANDGYYLDYDAKKDNVISDGVLEEENNKSGGGSTTTVIEHEVQYSEQSITSMDEATQLIKNEALRQEVKCENAEILDIDVEISNVTGISGVNLCEIDVEVAKEINLLMKKLYEQYPILSGYVTNLTLVNDGGKNSYIAAFKPAFTFATSNSSNKFPFVIKIQVFLNASYFLDINYFDLTVQQAVETGYFPRGANKYSLIAHEFGHALTYVLAIDYYDGVNSTFLPYDNFRVYIDVLKKYANSEFSSMIVKEAFNNYVAEIEKITADEFRKNISGYANSFDEQGEVMYNETVAEAFHDYFLNGDGASEASLAVMNVLNSYIEGKS